MHTVWNGSRSATLWICIRIKIKVVLLGLGLLLLLAVRQKCELSRGIVLLDPFN